MKTVLLIAILTLALAHPIFAKCIYNGTVYPTGTRLGPLVCMADGTWKPAK
jgi:hypothetical protein